MRIRNYFLIAIAGFAVLVSETGLGSPRAQMASTVAVTGQVSSTEEGPMEGVLVSAKKTGSTVTITVVSDQQGRYAFPANKMEPGQYSLKIRAVGYDLDGPGTVEIAPQKTATADLKLRKTKDLASQLTSAEWMLSAPGTEPQKAAVMLRCVGCHTLQPIVKSQHDADEFVQVMTRMAGYTNGSTPLNPQRYVVAPRTDPERLRELAAYLSTINLSSVPKWEYSLKTFPRPKGRATHVIITEYDLPRPLAQPHDVVVDPDGMVWYSDFGEEYLGKLDPKTAKVTEFPLQERKKGYPHGSLALEFDKDNNLWMGMKMQGSLAKFNRKTEKFQIFVPPGVNSDVAQVMPVRDYVDGKVWMNDIGVEGLHRLDIESGKFDTFLPYRDIPKDSPLAARSHQVYGIAADSQNNIYFMDHGDENIGRVDARTGKITIIPTPTPNSTPHRGHMDSRDHLWFGESRANGVGMFDTRTGRFLEWVVPTPWSYPYDAVEDKNGEVWAGAETSDRVARLDPKTGQFVEYLFPRRTDIRRVFVDNSTTPVTFWVGSNHGASIIKVEPLD
jgi:virginiamycin B lyase